MLLYDLVMLLLMLLLQLTTTMMMMMSDYVEDMPCQVFHGHK